MSIAYSAAWEVRPTVGNDTNGGGFDPLISGAGTDYSKQDSPNSGGNNASVTDGVGAGSTTILSATASFTSALIGNIVYFDGAWYAVTAVGSGTSITVDRNTTTGTGLTLNIGGALATFTQAFTNYVSGNVIWVKGTSGDYLTTSAATIGNALNGMVLRGYGTTRGDGGQAVWKTATNSTRIFNMQGLNNAIFRNIVFKSTAGSPAELLYSNSSNSQNVVFINCRFTGGTYGIRFDWSIDWTCHQLVLEQCEFDNCSVGCYMCYAIRVFGCYFHDLTVEGLHLSSQDIQTCAYVSRCTFRNCNSGASGNGAIIHNGADRALYCENCNFTANTGAGIYLFSEGPLSAVNCIFWDNSVAGLQAPGTQSYYVSLRNCAFGSNGTDLDNLLNVNNTFNDEPITLTADPFTNQSAGDFSLNSTSGGGAACMQAGIPSVMP